MLFAMEAMRIIFSFLLALVVFMTTFVVAGGIAVLITNYYIAPFLAETFVNARRWWAGRSANIDVLKGGEPPNEVCQTMMLPVLFLACCAEEFISTLVQRRCCHNSFIYSTHTRKYVPWYHGYRSIFMD